MSDRSQSLVLWFKELTNQDVPLVGGKNASLGEMYQNLTGQGVRIPNGFAVTAYAYREFVEATGLKEFIKTELSDLDTHDVRSLQKKGARIRKAFLKYELPDDLKAEIITAYQELSQSYDQDNVDVAVRSSATAEDLPGASFAGQQETYLNISGEKALLRSIRSAMASLFTDRAISYRTDKGFDHFDVALSVGVQKMVRSDQAASGVMFTLDTDTGFRDVVQISSSWGLGEMVVQGKVTPDEFLVYKPSLAKGLPAVIKKQLGEKATKMIYRNSQKNPVREVSVDPEHRHMFSLTDEEILTLAKWGVIIEEYYTNLAGVDRPMDMEWAQDGLDGNLYIVQARPETVQSERNQSLITEYHLETTATPIVTGIAVGQKVVSGAARIITDTKKLHTFQDGEILITEITDPDWEPIMKKASAIITEKGGRTSHAAIVSRELGIPAVIGAPGATSTIKTGDVITVDTSSGVTGNVYAGKLEWTEETHDLGEIPKTTTNLCLNVGTPEGAFTYSFLPHHGVGLAREEFIIASHIRVHPLALLQPEKVTDKSVQQQIAELTVGYDEPADYYIHKLAEGIAQIGAAFAPHQVIVRFSDFKTNEYRTLLGGEFFEPEEENPMLGWRGASRYAHPDFRPAFDLEVRAMKRVRDTFGITNVYPMIPFCRTPKEGQQVVDIMAEGGLVQGENGLKIYMMCEIPTNVIRADEFLDIFDGFSIGSNDLAQLTLGMDRDSALVAPISNENDPAVRKMVSMAIQACKARGKYIGFCGQAPSDYPDFTQFLVTEGIDAISLNPDSIIPMTFKVAETESTKTQ